MATARLRLLDIQQREKFLIDPLTRFEVNWDNMLKKTKELEEKATKNTSYKDAAKAAKILGSKLTTARETFLKSKNYFDKDKEEFCSSCIVALDEARLELSHHRGWGQIIADLTVNLLIFLGTASLSMIVAGRFQFFKPCTDSENKRQALEKSLNGTIYIAPEFKFSGPMA